MAASPGLRERKKADTRLALSLAAMSLAVEEGVDGVTAEAIAGAANVSVRTFHNYFRNKEEAVLAPYQALADVAAAELLARPAVEPILDSLERIATRLLDGSIALPGEAAVQAELLWSSPHMAAYRPILARELIRPLVGVIAARTGTHPATDLYPRLVAAVAAAAVLTAFEMEGDGAIDARLRRVRDAFGILRAGLATPAAIPAPTPTT